MNLFNPSIYVKIGKFMWQDAIDVDTSSSSDSLIDWAKLNINESILEKAKPIENDLVDINIGYEDKIYNVFAGNIDNIVGKTIICKDDMQKLAKTKITASFTKATPRHNKLLH